MKYCYKCKKEYSEGYATCPICLNSLSTITQERIKIEEGKKEYAKSFGDFYEYDIVTVINENHGQVDKYTMMQILKDRTNNGWKLHTIYSNELGKNAIQILGLGVNSTACEDVMIFERRIPEV